MVWHSLWGRQIKVFPSQCNLSSHSRSVKHQMLATVSENSCFTLHVNLLRVCTELLFTAVLLWTWVFAGNDSLFHMLEVSLPARAPTSANWFCREHFSPHIMHLVAAEAAKSGREGHRMSCMSFSVFNSSQPVTMETVSWGELKTKNAVQIQVAAGVCLSHQRPPARKVERRGVGNRHDKPGDCG